MIALPIISIVCCIAYIAFIVLRYGVPVSLSETYYILPNKWDWLFAAWTVLTSVPFGIYWWQIAPDNLKWIPIVVMIAMLMIGVADCYKSGPKNDLGDYDMPRTNGHTSKFTIWKRMTQSRPFIEKLRELLKQFNPKEFFKYGVARFLHYTNSLVAIILSTVYLCMTGGAPAITFTALSYPIFIVIGCKTDGVYNPDYSLDYNNSSWIFFMEVLCVTSMFVFIWR